MIRSMLDTDLYQLTMMQVVYHFFPNTDVIYKFKCRTPGINFKLCFDQIMDSIGDMCDLRFERHDITHLRRLGWFKEDFLDYLTRFKLNRDHIRIAMLPAYHGSKGLSLTIAGPWLNTIPFPTPLLSIISESYHAIDRHKFNGKRAINLLRRNIDLVRGTDLKFADFGTRRRFSSEWQRYVLKYLKRSVPQNFIGTSNVLMAAEMNLKPIGTMAHEFLQAMQAMTRIDHSQRLALQTWADEYRGDLGIALTDVVGMDAFLQDFDKYFSKLYDGMRHDSGSPTVWAKKAIAHYNSMGIDARTKQAVFSNKVTIPLALQLHKRFSQLINPSFGMGKFLMNNIPGIKPLDMVIKMVVCNGQPVAKISDSPGKGMCEDAEYLAHMKRVFNIERG